MTNPFHFGPAIKTGRRRWHTRVFSIFMALAFFSIPTCAQTSGTDSESFAIPAEFATELKDYHKKFTSLSGFEYSGLHWNQFVRVYISGSVDVYFKNHAEYLKWYVNEDGGPEEKKQFATFPIGTVVVKEHYTPRNGKPGAPTTLAIMIKRQKGYDPDRGDWQYAWTTATGQVIMHGKSSLPNIQASCAACHQNMQERDYIYATFAVMP